MSGDALDSDTEELNELLAEYRSKEEESGERPVEHTVQQDDDSIDEQKYHSKNDESKGKYLDSSQEEINETSNNKFSMDKVLFGDKTRLIKHLENAITAPDQKEIIDEDEQKSECKKGSKKRKPVWNDEDDEGIQLGEVKRETKRTGPLDHLKMDKPYKEYLTSRFTRIVNQPKWASLDNVNKESDEDEEILRTVGFLNKPSESVLTSGHLNIKKLKDLNRATYGEGAINSIQFHPTSTAALVAGERGIASIYAVDGIKNDKLHNIHIANFPIKCARLLPCGTKAVFGSIRRVAYLYDLINAKETCFHLKRDYGDLSNFTISPCGRYLVSGGYCGEIHIYEAKTFEIIRTLKQNDEVASLCFTSDSQRLIASGKSSNISVFSMRQQRLEHKFIDDGCIVGSTMDLSPNQRLLATGSEEGVVNVYDFDKVMLSTAPQPEKTLLNLTTSISCVRFNHTSELLAFCSSLCKDKVKIAHFPSGTVYANFPDYMPKFGNVRVMEFSPQSAYMAMGADKKCPLIRIKHFQNY